MLDPQEMRTYLKSLSVLYVEDDEATRELGGELLTRLIGVLITANDGLGGLNAYREHNPDIIITDIQMPVMDGLTMLQEIRSLDKCIPVIVLSASEESEHLQNSINLGANGYVIKPINIAKMIESLQECARKLLLEKRSVEL